MTKVDSWQVDILWIYLRTVMSRQLSGLAKDTRASLQRVVDNKPDLPEIEALEKVLRIRTRLQNSRQEITMEDYGAGSTKSSQQRTVGSIHRSSAVPHWWGVFLFRLVRELKPKSILELGSNLGVSGAYIQSALDLNGGPGRFTTIEGDPTLGSIARETLEGKGDVVVGKFQDALLPVLKQHEALDLVFIDGHHEYQPTLDYFDRIKPFLNKNASIVFDDVYVWSRPVRKAWKQIIETHPIAMPIDLAKFGLLFWHGFAKPTQEGIP